MITIFSLRVQRIFLIGLVTLTALLTHPQKVIAATTPWWPFQSIDTMKYSRDPSREFLSNPQVASQVIVEQMNVIAATGVTHVAIATPYDEEFYPILQQWVTKAREHNLKVWFRGNWSGWERWFGYSQITREEHIEKTKEFILSHPDLFETGDAFTACPECENGGPGDPRLNRDVAGHRQFLIDEYQIMQESFRAIGKNVRTNLHPMNGDVARLIMDEQTTQALGGVVTIDHYVRTPEQLVADISAIARQSKGAIVLGEFGAPIPDIHGNFSEEEQAAWLDQSLSALIDRPELIGISYWTSFGGSTELWYQNGQPKKAVEVVTTYFVPKVINGTVLNQRRKPVANVQIWSQEKKIVNEADGTFVLPYTEMQGNIIFSASGYKDTVIDFESLDTQVPLEVTLEKNTFSIWESVVHFLRSLFG
jgi:hypothetical protein